MVLGAFWYNKQRQTNPLFLSVPPILASCFYQNGLLLISFRLVS